MIEHSDTSNRLYNPTIFRPTCHPSIQSFSSTLNNPYMISPFPSIHPLLSTLTKTPQHNPQRYPTSHPSSIHLFPDSTIPDKPHLPSTHFLISSRPQQPPHGIPQTPPSPPPSAPTPFPTSRSTALLLSPALSILRSAPFPFPLRIAVESQLVLKRILHRGRSLR